MGEGIGMGIGRCHGAADTPFGEPNLGADFEELDAYGAACGFGEASACERDASGRGEQDIGHGGEPEAELTGVHGDCGVAVGEEANGKRKNGSHGVEGKVRSSTLTNG